MFDADALHEIQAWLAPRQCWLTFEPLPDGQWRALLECHYKPDVAHNGPTIAAALQLCVAAWEMERSEY